jgi:[ribosomal protein S5]-alanine N-acetyltransferase
VRQLAQGSIAMQIVTARLVLRDFTADDAPAFVAYQSDPRYLALHAGGEANPCHARDLLQRFARWRDEVPRRHYQLGVFERVPAGALLGCAGLREVDDNHATAELGIELAPDRWGRYGLAVEIARALLDTGFARLELGEIRGVTASGNARAARLARWFGAEVVATRPGPDWMRARGWSEVEWRIRRSAWQQALAPTRRRA